MRPNFSKTETETFFRDQIFQNRNQDFFSETKFSETLKDLAKVSKPRSFETEMSISDLQIIISVGICRSEPQRGVKELLSPAMELPDSSGLHHPTAAAVNSKTRRSWTFVLKT